MAGGQERVLRRRIKSVQSTKKITKAMELIAGSRIVKAQQRVQAARPYSERITEVIGNLARAGAGGDSPLLNQREDIGTIAYVVIAGDRGLAGGYNSGVIRTAERALLADRADGKQTRLITVGKKAQSYFAFRGYEIDETFAGFLDQPSYEDARKVAAHVTERFESGEYDEVRVAYTQFISIGVQRPAISAYMPLDPSILEQDRAEGAAPSADYEFEPSPTEILERLLPRYAEARLFAHLLDATASFFASQQRAMKSASENADDMIVRLSRVMNRARQDSITTEIMEIVGGAEALRQAGGTREDLLIDDVTPLSIFASTSGDNA